MFLEFRIPLYGGIRAENVLLENILYQDKILSTSVSRLKPESSLLPIAYQQQNTRTLGIVSQQQQSNPSSGLAAPDEHRSENPLTAGEGPTRK